jgi:hypothetical protein
MEVVDSVKGLENPDSFDPFLSFLAFFWPLRQHRVIACFRKQSLGAEGAPDLCPNYVLSRLLDALFFHTHSGSRTSCLGGFRAGFLNLVYDLCSQDQKVARDNPASSMDSSNSILSFNT